MKLLPLAAVFVCLAAAVTVRADGIPDGRIGIGHGSDPQKPVSCGLQFKIKLNGKGGGIENCVNTSGQDWFGLDIFAVIPATATVTCTTFFSVCQFMQTSRPFGGKVDIEIMAFGDAVITPGSITTTVCNPAPPSPIPSSCFFINLNDGGTSGLNDPGGWFGFDTKLKDGHLTVEAITTPITTPEPSTFLLVAISLGILSARRRVKSLR